MVRKTILIVTLVVFVLISECIGESGSQVEKDKLSEFNIKYSDDIPTEIYTVVWFSVIW